MPAFLSEQPCAPVAQLDRVGGFEPLGREFESLRARHFTFLKRLKLNNP